MQAPRGWGGVSAATVLSVGAYGLEFGFLGSLGKMSVAVNCNCSLRRQRRAPEHAGRLASEGELRVCVRNEVKDQLGMI